MGGGWGGGRLLRKHVSNSNDSKAAELDVAACGFLKHKAGPKLGKIGNQF